MAIDSEDFKTFFEVAYKFKSMDKIKCFKCGIAMQENADKSGLVCAKGHTISYFEYMTLYSSMLKAIVDSTNEVSSEEADIPEGAIFIGDKILLIENKILRI